MVPVSRAATVEAGETDVQPGIVVLDHVRCCTGGSGREEAYNGVEALGAVLAVYRLGWAGDLEGCEVLFISFSF